MSDYYAKIETWNSKIFDLLLESDSSEKEISEELEKVDEYKAKFLQAEMEYAKRKTTSTPANSDSGSNSTVKQRLRAKLKLPKFQLPTFDGHVKNWVSFWSQFKKIDEDETELSDDDKMHYLLQAMEKGTSARDLIESFPPCGENYKKALSQLKQRFAQDEFITEYYVRELLQLVIAKGKSKLSTRQLYDQLMTQIQALETLGLTQDKYASFLYPMVESALPDEILKSWLRSNFHTNDKGKSLSKLLDFVKLEVESEEKIRMAQIHYNHSIASPALASASCLTTSDKKSIESEVVKEKEKLCIWCEKSSHTSSECTIAMKMTLEERKEFIKKNKACFICLRKGHPAKLCRRFPKCLICGKRHYALMCNDLPKPLRNEKQDNSSQQTVMNQSEQKKTVLLQTLKVNISYNGAVLPVRALIDSGAQRSFIKSDVVKKLKMESLREEQLSQNLFGGTVTKKRKYRVFDVQVSSLDSSYHCKIEALEQTVLCGYLPKLREGSSVLKDLSAKGISLTDCLDDESEISLLIGSDF